MTEEDQVVKVIGITGGPAGGKTTIMADIEWELVRYGITPVRVPEAARFLMEMGIHPSGDDLRPFQNAVIRAQLAHEDIAHGFVRTIEGERIAILCDRGIPDSLAYAGESLFSQLLEQYGLTRVGAREGRYDAVIHLVTAAFGAEQHYCNDKHRRESLEEARELDMGIRHAWIGQEHPFIIGNTADFEEKKRQALLAVLSVFGLPVPLEIERKFRLFDRSVLERLPEHAQTFDIEQFYPYEPPEGEEERFRKRGQNGSWTFYRTLKKQVRPSVREERQSRVTEREYEEARSLPGNFGVRKRRTCFLENGLYFELDDFEPMGRDMLMLEIELTEEQQEVSLPSWLGDSLEVTEDPAFGNRNLSVPLVELDA